MKDHLYLVGGTRHSCCQIWISWFEVLFIIKLLNPPWKWTLCPCQLLSLISSAGLYCGEKHCVSFKPCGLCLVKTVLPMRTWHCGPFGPLYFRWQFVSHLLLPKLFPHCPHVISAAMAHLAAHRQLSHLLYLPLPPAPTSQPLLLRWPAKSIHNSQWWKYVTSKSNMRYFDIR